MKLEIIALELGSEERFLGLSYIGRRDIRKFGNLIGDHISQHRSKREARKMELFTTPIIGTHLLSEGMQIAESCTKNKGRDLTADITWRKPTYPKKEIEWYGSEKDGKIEVVAKQGGLIKAEMTFKESKLASPTGPPLCTELIEIDVKKMYLFHKMLKSKFFQQTNRAFGYSLMAPSIMRIIKERQDTEDLRVFHTGMIASSLDYLEQGQAQMQFYQEAMRKSKDGCLYKFRAQITQHDRIKSSAIIKCLTSKEIELEKIAD